MAPWVLLAERGATYNPADISRMADGERSYEVSLEELIADPDWIRSLARTLVADENQVDDMVQHTLLAVLGFCVRSRRP